MTNLIPLFDYVPTRIDKTFKVKESYIDIRQKIWDFKNGISSSHDFFLPKIRTILTNTINKRPNQEIIIIPIPASTFVKTFSRFNLFLFNLCNEFNIVNGFNYIISDDVISAHLGGNRVKNFKLNNSFTIKKDALIILLDDIYTTGTSYSSASSLFKENEVGGLFLGRTIGYNDNIWDYCDKKY